MVAIIQAPEDVVNLALVQIGWKRRIGSLYDGSEASKLALDIYGQTRDAMLRKFEWGFAERDVALTLLKSAPAGGYGATVWTSEYPILPFLFEYAYPADCLKLRALRTTPIFVPDFDPKYNRFRIANDNSLAPEPTKVILSDLANAVAVYTAQVTDPTQWENDFIKSLADELAKLLAPALANLDMSKLAAAEESQEEQTAQMTVG